MSAALLQTVDQGVPNEDGVGHISWATKIQRSLKKAHSYFVIARKGGFYPFGYKSVQAR